MTGWIQVSPTVFDKIDSTNEEARRRIAAGETGAAWIAAREQSAGRGRQGRTWSSAPGNLAASLILPLDGSPREAALYSFVTALAVADVMRAYAPQHEIALKWPNDVLLNRRKVSGILLESLDSSVRDSETILVIGIGLNLAHHPDQTQSNWPPTSLSAEVGAAPTFDHALQTLIDAMATRIERHRNDGFETTRTDWMGMAENLGGVIKVRLPNQTLEGRFAGLDSNGSLMLDHRTGRRLIAAGDVFFPESA